MKCIRCNTDSKFKDRTGKRCPKCEGAFAFEPQSGDPLTDMAFKAAIDAVSANGRMRWGVEHLYYEICRRWKRGRKNHWFAGLVAVVVSGGSLTIPGLVPLKILALVLSGIGTYFIYKLARQPVLIGKQQFDSLWTQWNRVHGQPKGLIVRQASTQPAPSPPPAQPARVKETDIGDYSFDRAVICDRARTADLLLANNFHFEHNCAVLSIDGYPPGPFKTVRTMLRRNPRLQVYALHDATPVGCKMALQLANDKDWFQDHVKIVDVGLRPVHASRLHHLCLPYAAGVVAAGDGIAAAEAQWLSRRALEIAVFRPEYVLKQLFGAMTRKKESPDGSGGNGGGGGGIDGESSVVNDNESFTGQGGEFGGGGADDSFG